MWQGSLWVMVALTVLAAGGCDGSVDQPPDRKDPPRPLPEKLVGALKKAGAKVGWMRVDAFGSISFRPEKEGQAGDLPAFQCHRWEMPEGESGGIVGPKDPQDLVVELPVPTAAFGLDLSDTQTSEAGLKETVARFKNIQALSLVNVRRLSDGGCGDLVRHGLAQPALH